MPPVAYLTWSYYEHWYFATAQSLLEAGMITMEELRTGRAAAGRPKRNDAMRPADVDRVSKGGGKFARTIDTPPRFSAGQTVSARNLNPTGHTRLPRYARGKRGLVHRWHGAHVFADASARGDGEMGISHRHVHGARALGRRRRAGRQGLSRPLGELPDPA
jgi:nitrile hydratase